MMQMRFGSIQSEPTNLPLGVMTMAMVMAMANHLLGSQLTTTDDMNPNLTASVLPLIAYAGS